MKLLQYLLLSAGLYACAPPEKGDENPCADAEVIFEDEFEGSELDEGKWETNDALLRPRGGILEMNVNNQLSTVYIQSRSTYTLDDRTLCFEARWKVREREGTDLVAAILKIDYAGIGFALDSQNQALTYDANEGDCFSDLREVSSSADLTQLKTYRVVANKQKADFYINDEFLGSIRECIPASTPLNIYISCQSRDDTEKKCSVDYVKLER